MARREKRLTKREKKEQNPRPHTHDHAQHIHCIACGKHLDPDGFDKSPPDSIFLRCQHGSQFPCCAACEVEAQFRIDEHDRNNKPVTTARAWH